MFTAEDVKHMEKVAGAMRHWASRTPCKCDVYTEEDGAAYNAMLTIIAGDDEELDLFTTVCDGVWSVVAFHGDKVLDEWRSNDEDAHISAYMKVNYAARILAVGR